MLLNLESRFQTRFTTIKQQREIVQGVGAYDVNS